MKKAILIIGVILIVLCILSLLFAALFLFGYYHVLDGSPEMYANLHRRAILCFVLGIVLAVLGAASIVISRKQG